jgi:hypothetical protein
MGVECPMKLPFLIVVLAGLISGPATAADIGRLEWGSFVVESDSSNGWDAYKSASSDDGRSITMKFAPLDAKADGSTLEANADFSGHYDIIQPDFDSYSNCVVILEGHVIKSESAVTRIVLTVGSVEKTVEWPAGEAVSEKFSRNVEVMLPGKGRLPDPFFVGVRAYARKVGPADAAYVSIDSMTIRAATSQVAAN